MASSGSFNTSAYDGRYLQFSWKETNQNVANNTTTISWTLKGAGTGGVAWYNAGNFKVVIAGETVFSSANRIQLYNGTTVASGTYTFKHNSDGSKTFAASAEAGIYTNAVNCSGSGNFTLDTIPRASQPSCITYPKHTQNVGYFGDTISIHMNRNSAAFTHTVRYAFGNLSGTCINADTGKAATGIETGFKWKIPESFMDLLTTVTSGSGTIYVDTYNGSTKIGTKYCGFTASVPSSIKPKCSIQVLDGTNTKDLYGSLVKGLSTLYVKTTGTPAYSSPIRAYSVTANNVHYTAAEITTGVLTKAGNTTVTATVTDRRGRTSAAASATFPVLDYSSPSISKLTVNRCNEDGTANRRGAYIKAVFSAAITSLNNKNTALYKLKYKKTSDTAYTEISLVELTNKYSVSNYAYIFPASTGSSYEVVVTAADRHSSNNPAEKTAKASTAVSILSWRGFKTSNGKEDGLGVGKVPEKPNTMQVGWDAEFERSTVQIGNSYSFQPEAFNGEKGYTLLAQITLNTLNVNAPIVFKINRRGAICPMTVYIRFASSSSSTDPDLGSFTYEGDNYGAFLIKEAVSTWKLYVDNTSGWSNPCVQEWYTTDNQMARMTVSFPSEQIAELPDPYYRATPAKLPSIVDFVYPVGSIYLSYSHVSPATLFGGTWMRIENAFLWATTASGTIGQTGGEETHTLTVDELPAHSHGSVYSQHASGTKDKAWYNTTGTAVAYGAVSTGGGKEHNNMPPYIQVSVWRRTA